MLMLFIIPQASLTDGKLKIKNKQSDNVHL